MNERVVVLDATCPACGRLVAQTVYRADYPGPRTPPWNLHTCEHAPAGAESSLRTRRSELVLAGLVRDTGERSLTLAGRACVRWEAT